ncbi:MAG: AmmeMemoRadiSam system protein B [Candidatus Heimdallarchaeaceae archaeon]
MKRRAFYAGRFYDGREKHLIESIEECFNSYLGPESLPGGVEFPESSVPYFLVPHAGYMFSGPVAASSYLEMSKYKAPDTVVIFGPNHTGLGADIGVPDKVTEWETPLGSVKINHELIDELMEINSLIRKNDSSHVQEHSIEVQLPFLQYILKEPFQIVPIAMMNQSYDSSLLLGETLAKLVNDENIVVIASSDFTHFETHESARNKDNQVLAAIEKMDAKEMYDIKLKLNVSMCGLGPIAATLETAKQTERSNSKILNYATSGDAPKGNREQVVGYGSAMFYK